MFLMEVLVPRWGRGKQHQAPVFPCSALPSNVSTHGMRAQHPPSLTPAPLELNPHFSPSPGAGMDFRAFQRAGGANRVTSPQQFLLLDKLLHSLC